MKFRELPQINKYWLTIAIYSIIFVGSIEVNSYTQYLYNINYVSKLISFLFISFVPGFMVFRLISFNKVDNVSTMLHSIGISIFLLMMLGFLLNYSYLAFGMENPISREPLTVLLSALLIALFLLHYNKYKKSLFSFKAKRIPKQIWYISITPTLAVVGTYLMNKYNYNLLIIILILSLCIITMYTTWKDNHSNYPWIIFILSISLLFHRSLISMNITGSESTKFG